MNKPEFYKRISGIFQPERIEGKKAVVIGLGSGGCRVAAELGRLGVGLFLVERPGERLREHNIVRHLLGYRSLGKPKLDEMVKYIANLNPSTPLTPCALDVVKQNQTLARLLKRWQPDVLAVCTDNEQSKHAVNRVAVRLGIPQVGAGVYDGGIGGEVYCVRPGQACYGCIASHLRLERYTPEIPRNLNYNHLDLEEIHSTCALNLDIEQIALLHARVVLDLLLREDGKESPFGLPAAANLWVFANRAVPGTFARPLHGEFFKIDRRPDCLDCGDAAGNFENEASRILASLQTSPGSHAG